MPRYRSPSRTPSPSRSPSRGRATSRARSSRSRGRSTYSDGVYSTTSYSSRSRSRSRSRSYSRSPTRSTRSRRTDVTSSSRQTGTTKRGGPLSHILDTSASTKSEKAENIAKTSLVMLGAIGAATLAAHRFWPKGVTYGDKEDWEHEDKEKSKRERVKDKAKDVKAAVTGEPRRDERGGSGSGSGSGGRDDDRRDDERRGSGGGGRGGRDRDRSRERRERYLEERERYGRPNIARDGIAPGRMVLPAAAAGARAAYQEDRRRRRDEDDDRPPPPPPPPGPRDRDRDRYDDYDPREWRDRYAEGGPPLAATYPATQRRVERVEQYTSAGPPPPPPPPPPAPNPPSSVAASYSRADAAPAPVVISTGGDRVRSAAGRYYVDRDTIVIPSRGETEFVVNRAGPPGGRLTTVEREGRIYR